MAHCILKLIMWPILSIFIKEIKGIENLPKNKFILAANHASYIDGPLLIFLTAWHRNKKLRVFATNAPKFRTLMFYILFKMVGAIRINGSLQKGIEALRKGDCLGIFPEGERTPNGQVQKITHTGLGVVALKTKLPVIPIGTNTFWFWNKYKKLPTFKRNIRIHIGEPLKFDRKCTKQNAKKTVKEVTNKITQLVIQANA